MSRLLLLVSFAFWIASSSTAVATDVVKVRNERPETLILFLKGAKDKNWRGPYQVPPCSKLALDDVTPDRYQVTIQHPDKRRDHLGWQDYSDPKITYRISLCDSCRVGPGEIAPRLGVYVIDGQKGVIITQVLNDSPSRKLHPIVGDTSKTHYLSAGKAIIISVNGKPTPNTTEFLKVLVESPNRVELTVSSLRGQIVEKYWTELSK